MSELAMWTVYDHPKDYPKHFIARRFEVSERGPVATASVILSAEIGPIREQLMAMGLVCLTRSPGDDAPIVETWL